MTDEHTSPAADENPPQPVPLAGTEAGDGGNGNPPRPRVYKLRLALIVAGLGGLAVVSTVFGMMMAVAGQLPNLENRQEYRNARNSKLYDINGKYLGILTSRNNTILIGPNQVSPAMTHAITAVEDQRFFENSGIDIRGIARALFADVARKKAVQGASTITQQFVKNALAAQNSRTIFEKLREAALAYHLTRKWTKEKILAEYLNAVYFGNGAYGIESAARTYFRYFHAGCGMQGAPLCSSLLNPWEAALLAGMVASPAAYDPIAHPLAARARRDLVLAKMQEQGYITRAERESGRSQPIPDPTSIELPHEDSPAPYFTSWVRQQVIDHFGAARALNGGLQIRTTLDVDLQTAAQTAVNTHLQTSTGPAASLVAIDNRTGEVRAMIGGRPGGVSYENAPFNLATQGQRQPGSAFKAFVLAAALRAGIDPGDTFASQKKSFTVPNSRGQEQFIVRNFEGEYAGIRTLADATAQSDNSVFAEVGIRVGVAKIARLAQQMGIRTPVSTNYAITLGGLRQGVTALDMAHAFETIASGGFRMTGSLAASENGPVGIHSVTQPGRHREVANRPRAIRVFSRKLASVETELLQGVVSSGTGVSAATGGFAAGKTGTTENNGDAWFVGFNRYWTVAVWVGYPDSLRPMRFDFNGGPVIGGSYPAEIWHDFIVAAEEVLNQRAQLRAEAQGQTYTAPEGSIASGAGGTDTTGDSGSTSTDSSQGTATTPSPSPSSGGGSAGGSGGGSAGGGSGGGGSGGGGASGGAAAPSG